MNQFLPFLGTALLLACLAVLANLVVTHSAEPIRLVDLGADEQSSEDDIQRSEDLSLLPSSRPEIFYAAITDRPLFAEMRRPNRPEPEVPELDEEPFIEQVQEAPLSIAVPDLVLLGVVAGGATNSALISISGADPEWHRLGTEIAGWTLSKIDAQQIELREGERSLTIDLYRK